MGLKTLLFSTTLEAVANMPCNPHIGGSSKGHLVRELDCLGGEMGKNIDKSFTQIRMLNTSKGPAVYSLRAQADRKKYQMEMKHTLEKQPNLYLKQAEIVDIGVEDGKVKSVETNIGAIYEVDNVILATGTYLKGKIYSNKGAKSSLIVDNSTFELSSSNFKLPLLKGTFKNSPFNITAFVTDAFSSNRIVNGNCKFNSLDLNLINESACLLYTSPSPRD